MCQTNLVLGGWIWYSQIIFWDDLLCEYGVAQKLVFVYRKTVVWRQRNRKLIAVISYQMLTISPSAQSRPAVAGRPSAGELSGKPHLLGSQMRWRYRDAFLVGSRAAAGQHHDRK